MDLLFLAENNARLTRGFLEWVKNEDLEFILSKYVDNPNISNKQRDKLVYKILYYCEKEINKIRGSKNKEKLDLLKMAYTDEEIMSFKNMVK